MTRSTKKCFSVVEHCERTTKSWNHISRIASLRVNCIGLECSPIAKGNTDIRPVVSLVGLENIEWPSDSTLNQESRIILGRISSTLDAGSKCSSTALTAGRSSSNHAATSRAFEYNLLWRHNGVKDVKSWNMYLLCNRKVYTASSTTNER